MISLIAPIAGADRIFVWQMAIVGPCDLYGLLAFDQIDLPSSLDTMSESRGLHHDNNVDHIKLSGDMEYLPLMQGAIGSPYAPYPDRVYLPALTQLGKAYSLLGNCGIAGDPLSARVGPLSTCWNIKGFMRDPDNPELLMELEVGTTVHGSTTVVSGAILKMTQVTFSTSVVTIKTSRQAYAPPIGTSYVTDTPDWSIRQPVEVMYDFLLSRMRPTTSLNSQNTATWYYLDRDAVGVFSPEVAKLHCEALAQILLEDNFPLEDYAYGDLAKTASEQLIKNDTNMIEFIRDLRHPKELVPKLRNLRNLKNLANAYLSVHYGVLPTIGDLTTIIGAFKKISPYLDRNGFSTYSAGHISSQWVDTMFYQLEQHLKLAVGDEDSGFRALIQRLESMGTLPTFKNVWDLVPYSFVIDWFSDVGEFLDRVDTRLRISRLDIKYVTSSRKQTFSGMIPVDPSIPYKGSIDLVHYHRWVEGRCPAPSLAPPPSQGFTHWVEATALLVQRRRR